MQTKRVRTVGYGLLAAVALYGIAGALLAPLIAKKVLAQRLEERLGRAVQIDDVDINPFTLQASLQGLRILEPDRKTPFVSFDELDLDGSAASVYRLAPVIDELTLTGLKVRVARDAQSKYSFGDIVERLARAAREAPKEPKDTPAEPARFAVENIRIVNAAVDFDDRAANATHRISDVQVAIPFISSLPTHLKDQVRPSFSAIVNDAPVKLTGEALPFENTVRTRFDLDIRDLDLPRYLGYLPAGLPIRVSGGQLDAQVSLRFTQAAGKDPFIDVAGNVSLDRLALSSREGPLGGVTRIEADIASLDPIRGVVKLASLKIGGASVFGDQWSIASAEASDIGVTLGKRTARIGSLTTTGGRIALKRNPDGTLELPSIPSDPAPAPAPREKWDLALEKLALSGYDVTLADAAVKPATTHRIGITSVEARELTLHEGLKGSATAKLRVGKAGTVDASSSFALEPLQVKAEIDVRGIDLVPLRAYVAQFPAVALKSGSASAKGTLVLRRQGEGIRIGYTGSSEIANLASVDTLNKEDLLNWKSVRATGVQLNFAPDAPLDLGVGEVVVDKAYSRIVVTPEGTLNVQQLRTATPAQPRPAVQSAPAPPPRNVRIERISFVDSRLNFTDHFIRPNYTADVRELQGSVTNLSSDPASRAKVDLKGRWDAKSPVIIAGTVNPLRGDLLVDIAARGQEIELTKLSAYSQRYAGYGIKEGRLTLDVKYHIEGGKLEGRNRIVVDQLTFGDKVESPEATKLPVMFVVNLLKDKNGRIDLELPITGSLEDPKFEIGALIGQVIGNFFGRATTAPFSMLTGAAAGKDGEAGDLAFVEFEPGMSEITPAGTNKLDTLVKLLQDRPGIKLELAARMDATRDLEALKAAALKRKLDAAPKDLSKEAREKLAQEPVVVSEEELRALSARRAEQVKAYLVASGRLAPERVTVASAPAPAAEGSKAKLSRVDFALR